MKFGDYLRQIRDQHGWTQPEAAAKANIEQSYLSKLETGKSYPSEDIFERLVKAYSLDVREMATSIFSAELDKLREIGEVRAVVLQRQQKEAGFVRSWLIAGLIMLMLGGGMLGLASSTKEDVMMMYHYQSEGVIKSDEPPMIYQFMKAGSPDKDGKTYGDRVDYEYAISPDNRGDNYIERVEGGYRQFVLYQTKEHHHPTLLSWHYAFGFMFVVGGLGCFFISRRWR
ncbi:MAG: helix-turn-helix transcriptional regulator [Kordiimonadaceae bacterium]|nr:helix-turn-helix transcriptional regulator [Kordiimonadaceae bacterium]MBO6568227.1 helix-turn-helix transcriptional regulator [Kordiimonadaceae bacterium]MBO6964043.1 helix-turn-helix transcriptional regulator [Kordiimonadaceae bacterium]